MEGKNETNRIHGNRAGRGRDGKTGGGANGQQEWYGAGRHQPPEDRGRKGRKRHDDPAKFNPELAKVDPDINCINGHDDRHASQHPMSMVDWANGESVKY